MALRVIPVPSRGAEDVVVTADGGVYTGTEDGAVFTSTPRGTWSPASPTPAAARSASNSLPTAGCSSATPGAACSPSTRRPARSSLCSAGCLQQRGRRIGRHDLRLRLLDDPPDRRLE